ncbi:MAG: peptidoglycan-binding domain-containing protein [Acidimicrobiales bacterium]
MAIPTPATLRKGATGQPVKNAQALLIAHGADLQGIDGKFGPRTEAAARAFQQSRGLGDDGIVGPETWGALLRGEAGPPAGAGTIRSGGAWIPIPEAPGD